MKFGNLGKKCGCAEAPNAAADDHGIQVAGRQLIGREGLRQRAFMVIGTIECLRVLGLSVNVKKKYLIQIISQII